MKIHSLDLYNFGPYKGEQKVVFPTDGQKRVMVVFGDNMRGKTSLFNALRWVLYGRALDRNMEEIDLLDLVNWEAADSGDSRMRVVLAFEHDGDVFQLRRVAEPHPHLPRPGSGRDFEVTELLTKNHEAVRADQVRPQINRLIPEEISRFYLFDGELLREYEALLVEGSEQGERIKQSIEGILGVPALVNGRDELAMLLREAQKVQAKENKHSAALQDQARQSIKLQERVEAAQGELDDLVQVVASDGAAIEEINRELDRTEEARRAQAQLEGLRQKQTDAETRLGELENERLEVLADAWRDLLQPRLQLRRRELLAQLDEYRNRTKQAGAFEERIRSLEALLDEACPLCGGEVTGARREAAGRELGHIKADLAEVNEEVSAIGALSRELDSLNRLTGTGARQRLESLVRQIMNLRVEYTKDAARIAELEESLRHHDSARVAELQTRKERLQKHQAKAELKAEEKRHAIDEDLRKISHLSRLMAGDSAGRQQRSSREVRLYSGLYDVFSKSIEVLRERLKSEVESAASAAFRALTTEAEYAGLRINNNYGLTIVDRDGKSIPRRSAGAEQIVALALLSALNTTSQRPGPVVIDTPFARLDPKHRLNILRYVPHMAEQVVFLVHEGEIQREGGLDPIAEHVAAVYDIERVTERHSTIKRVSA